MERGSLEHLKLIVAQGVQSEDCIAFLEKLAQSVYDLRTVVGDEDSIVVRKAVGKYLEGAIDDIKRLRNTRKDQPNLGSYH